MPKKSRFSVPEVAKRLGVTPKAIYKHIKMGNLTPTPPDDGSKYGISITLTELNRFQNLPRTEDGRVKRKMKEPPPKRPRGRPRKPRPLELTPKRPRGRPRKDSDDRLV